MAESDSRQGGRSSASGCCQFGENWDQSPRDMIVDAAYEAYADAGIDDPQRQIDAVFTGSVYSQKGPHECSDALKLLEAGHAWSRTTARPAPTPSAAACSRSRPASTTPCSWSATTSRRTAASRARA